MSMEDAQSPEDDRLSLEEAQKEAQMVKFLANAWVQDKLFEALETALKEFEESHHPDQFINTKTYDDAQRAVEKNHKEWINDGNFKEKLIEVLTRVLARGSLKEGSHSSWKKTEKRLGNQIVEESR